MDDFIVEDDDDNIDFDGLNINPEFGAIIVRNWMHKSDNLKNR